MSKVAKWPDMKMTRWLGVQADKWPDVKVVGVKAAKGPDIRVTRWPGVQANKEVYMTSVTSF